jgi:hypothetical protein
VVCFLYNFHKKEGTLLSFSNLEKIKDHRVRHRRNHCAGGWETVEIYSVFKKYFRQLMMCKLKRAHCMVSGYRHVCYWRDEIRGCDVGSACSVHRNTYEMLVGEPEEKRQSRYK